MRDLLLGWTCCFAAVVAILCLTADSAVGQEIDAAPLRTPDGQPDLQGIWIFRTITPLQRPNALEGKEVLTPEEAATFEQAENRRLNRDLVDPEEVASQGGVVAYNQFWYERGNQLTEDIRTSLIVDPPDGRIPPLTAEAQERAEARRWSSRRPISGPRGISEGPARTCAWSNASRAWTPTRSSTNSRLKTRRRGRDPGRQWFP